MSETIDYGGGVTATITAIGGSGFDFQDFKGTEGIGVVGGTQEEVDSDTESLKIEFSVAVFVTGVGIGHLYHQAVFDETSPIGETVSFETALGTFSLQATGTTSATWDGLGSVSNLDPSSSSGGGEWSVDSGLALSIFGGTITELTLKPGFPTDERDGDDFSLTFVEFTAIPAPGGAILLGLAGMAATKRRRA